MLDGGFRFRLYLLLGGNEGLAAFGCAPAGPGVLPSLNGLSLLDITFLAGRCSGRCCQMWQWCPLTSLRHSIQIPYATSCNTLVGQLSEPYKLPPDIYFSVDTPGCHRLAADRDPSS